LRSLHTVFHGGCIIYIPINSVRRFLFSHILANICCCLCSWWGAVVFYFCICLSFPLKKPFKAGCQWLTPAILATQEAEIKRITVGSQPGQIIHETLSRKNPSQKRAGVGPEFKPQYWKKKCLLSILFPPTRQRPSSWWGPHSLPAVVQSPLPLPLICSYLPYPPPRWGFWGSVLYGLTQVRENKSEKGRLGSKGLTVSWAHTWGWESMAACFWEPLESPTGCESYFPG
jgi:hypothetical protein